MYLCKQKQDKNQLKNNILVKKACSGFETLTQDQVKTHNILKLQEAHLPFCSIDFKGMYTNDDVKEARKRLFNEK